MTPRADTMPGITAAPLWVQVWAVVPDPTPVTIRDLMTRLSPADARAVISAIRVAAEADVCVDEALIQLRGPGLDLSHAHTRALLEQWLPPELAVKVKALGLTTALEWVLQ